MRLLVDTHVLIWLLGDHSRLGPEARRVLAEPGIERLVSVVTLWEIVLKSGGGKLLAEAGAVAAAARAGGFEPLALDLAHVLTASGLPRFADHGDPFDRMLVAQAKAEGLTLMTVDPKLGRYEIPVLGCA